MKKVLSVALSTSLVLLPLVALGQVQTLPSGPQTIGDFLALLDKLANWLFSILLIVAVVFIVYAAFKFVTAGGNPGEIEQARHMVLYAVIGIVIAVAAKGFVAVAKSFVTG